MPPPDAVWVATMLPDVWIKNSLSDDKGQPIVRKPPMMGWYRLRFNIGNSGAKTEEQIGRAHV